MEVKELKEVMAVKRKENAGAREEPREILLGGGDGDYGQKLGA